MMTSEEKKCEDNFETTFRRNESGRFIVNLPFRDNFRQLGDSREQARKRFNHLETKLAKNPSLKKSYCDFMREYEALHHMSVCREIHPPNEEFYLPHHSIERPDSSTTKLRVVFDGSATSSSGLSINQVLMVGPQLQGDLFDLVLRFRRHNIVFTADIEKMYRQILVDGQHAQYQKILWRENPDQDLKVYQLDTVTYGTSSAPYLATKVLQKLAQQVELSQPIASKVIATDFYMDDLLSGSETVEEALVTISQLRTALESAGMNLRKWSSNNSSALRDIDDPLKSSSPNVNKIIKTLGLRWDPVSDKFSFDVKAPDDTTDSAEPPIITKRMILSDVAKIFDPLGLLAPVIVTAKMFLQSLWLQKLSWDEDLPHPFGDNWRKFRGKLIELNNISISRSMFDGLNRTSNVELHGYADASKDAYGACLYVRFEAQSGEICVNLLCSKTRVAPLQTTTIPRLELNAAQLLAKLASRVYGIMPDLFRRVCLWTDSSIVLAWLKLRPQGLKLYVANRVADIQELTSNFTWRHVNSKANPADVISRGLSPSDLLDNELWWHGPAYLKSSESSWPNKFEVVEPGKLPETKDESIFSFVVSVPEDVFNIHNYSSFVQLTRQVAYSLRFIRNLKEVVAEIRKRGSEHRDSIRKERKLYRCLNPEEIENAIKAIVKVVQRREFSNDIYHLEKNNRLPENSKLWSLSPFVDDQGLLRVGGRLQHSTLHFDQKHQLLIPKHHLSSLIVDFYHKQNLHGGIQSTLSSIRQKYWLLDGKNVVKKVIHRCVVCFRNHPRRLEQFMGSLPSSRTEIVRPFNTCGLDFCGPFSTRYKSQRKDTTNKTYVCVFVCFVTKAIHLECIEDLSSAAFIDGLKRFRARRGSVKTIWSDNGSNFVGARSELDRLQQMFFRENLISDFVTTQGITWKFIPPASPHFGGLWESAVRLFKLHFKKIVGSTVLTIELFWSLVIQIEGILNSRPLSPLSNDPVDLEPLTPAHFLTGGPITAILEPDLTTVPENRIHYWQKTRQISQKFWQRFSLEYIHTLQQRQKWTHTSDNLKKGDVVLIVEDNQPSSRWLLGIITDVVLGHDDLVRVATARTKNGFFKRAVTKFAKLPIN